VNKANYKIDKITIFNSSWYSIKIVQKNMILVQDILAFLVLFIILLLDDLNSFYNGTLRAALRRIFSIVMQTNEEECLMIQFHCLSHSRKSGSTYH
jgi:hypothetical protein